MTEDRALEIIALLGADPARWPDAERAGVLALAETPAIAAALADARALDCLLGAWAGADVAAAPFDAARLVPAPAVPSAAPRRRRWLGAGALAAAAAAVVVLVPMANSPAPAPQTAALSAPPSAAPSDADIEFAYVFTPTVDEDALI